MSVLYRYLVKSVLLTAVQCTLWVLIICAVLEIVVQLIEIQNNYQLPQVLMYMLWMLPSRIQVTAPLIGLLTGAALVSRWTVTQEWIAFRAMGWSVGRILGGVCISGILVIVVLYAVGEGLAPMAIFKAKQLRSRSQGDVLLTQQGLWWWSKQGQDDKILNYIHDIKTPQRLTGVMQIVQTPHSNNIATIVTAPQAIFNQGHWILKSPSYWFVQTGRTVQRADQRMTWPLQPNILALMMRSDRMISLPAVYARWKFSEYFQPTEVEEHAYHFFHRLYSPIFTLFLMCLSVALSSNYLRPRRSQITVGPAIVVGLIMYLIDVFMEPIAIILKQNIVVWAAMPIIVLGAIILCAGLRPQQVIMHYLARRKQC